MHDARPTGFTLIELLVVISIISTLSSIVGSSLNEARDKGIDASIRANMVEARKQAQLFYEANGGTYVKTLYTASDVCDPDAQQNGVIGIHKQLEEAAHAAGVSYATDPATAGHPDVVSCHSQPEPETGWAAQAPLKAGGFFCVDSSGNATTTAGTLGKVYVVNCVTHSGRGR